MEPDSLSFLTLHLTSCGIVHFRVVIEGSPWNGGQCFVHHLLEVSA